MLRIVPKRQNSEKLKAKKNFSVSFETTLNSYSLIENHELLDTKNDSLVRDFSIPYLELIRLLRESSEIEHALMVQYLYASFSIKPSFQSLAGIAYSGSTTLLGVAIQEMKHLHSVNKFLIKLGVSPNLDRQDFPYEPDIYPFEFNLEPLSLNTSAKYVYTESSFELIDPNNPANADELSINNTPFDIEEKLESHFADLASEYNFTPKVFIVKNGNTCDNSQQAALTVIQNNLPNLGAIIYLQDYENEDTFDFIHLKLFGMLPNDKIIGVSAGEGETEVSGGATSFEDLITTVKAAELRLISNGISSIESRIEAIRGIYYGTTWSMDNNQEGSGARNAGFNAYLYDVQPPQDPRQIIGDTLY